MNDSNVLEMPEVAVGPYVIDKVTDLDLPIPNDRNVVLNCLNCIEWARTPDVVVHIRRAMGPGKSITVNCVDLDALAYGITRGTARDSHIALCGNQDTPDRVHKSHWTRINLTYFLRTAGFRSVRVKCDGLSMSATGVARPITKPGSVTPKTIGVLSLPRITFTETYHNIFNALPGLGIDLHRHTGTVWEQSLSRMLYDIVDKRSAKYILAMDFDTLFKRQHVVEMIELMEDCPDIDALFPVQVKRETDDDVLAGWHDADTGLWHEIPFEARANGAIDGPAADLTPATTGHFGLTMLRVESLAKMPHPWFHGQPGAGGRWSIGKMDPDITFWFNLRKAGLKAYLANRVRVGHAQIMVSWPGEDGKPVHQYMTHYEKSGPPDAIRSLMIEEGGAK